jgi:hypothetical protein
MNRPPFLKKGRKLYKMAAGGKRNDNPSFHILETTAAGFICSVGSVDPSRYDVITSMCYIAKSRVTEDEKVWGGR